MERKPLTSSKILVSGVFMILALLWLTVSSPFVNQSQQIQKQLSLKQGAATSDEDSNPFSNTTEEKSESGGNTLSEYIHDLIHEDHPVALIKKVYKCHSSDIYFAFHPDLVLPPPKVGFSL